LLDAVDAPHLVVPRLPTPRLHPHHLDTIADAVSREPA
jgi:hypothetical protein